jgi:hypothetical protein
MRILGGVLATLAFLSVIAFVSVGSSGHSPAYSAGAEAQKAVAVSLFADPGNLQAQIGMPDNITLTVKVVPGPQADAITISGPPPFVTLTGNMVAGFYQASGFGTVAGVPGVGVALLGTYQTNLPDQPFAGTLNMGTNGLLGSTASYSLQPKQGPAPTVPQTPTNTPTSSPTRTATRTATPTSPEPQDVVDQNCTTIIVTDNGDIRSDDDAGIDVECELLYREAGPAPAGFVWSTAGGDRFLIQDNGPIRGDEDGVDLDAHCVMPLPLHPRDQLHALGATCTIIFRTFRHGLGGGAGGGSELIDTYETDPFQLSASAYFPYFGARWRATGLHTAIRSTTTDEIATYLTSVSVDSNPFGDLNCNFQANSVDAAIVLQLVAGLLSSAPCNDAGDVNLDLSVNAIDATLILQYTAGHIATLPRPR